MRDKNSGTIPGPRMRSSRVYPGVLAALFLLEAALIAGCSIPLLGKRDKPMATPPPEDIVSLKLPLYQATLSPGETVPESQIRYIGREESTYLVTIDGTDARKRVGDSLNWRGTIAPGVSAVYKLRILPTFSDSELLTLGSVEINILNPKPVEILDPGADASATIHLENVEIDYTVGLGSAIPGTPYVFEGKTDDGAIFNGLDDYPYRDLGDSLLWNGRLRGNVTVRYDMRVASIKEEEVRLLGIGELWIAPAR